MKWLETFVDVLEGFAGPPWLRKLMVAPGEQSSPVQYQVRETSPAPAHVPAICEVADTDPAYVCLNCRSSFPRYDWFNDHLSRCLKENPWPPSWAYHEPDARKLERAFERDPHHSDSAYVKRHALIHRAELVARAAEIRSCDEKLTSEEGLMWYVSASRPQTASRIIEAARFEMRALVVAETYRETPDEYRLRQEQRGLEQFEHYKAREYLRARIVREMEEFCDANAINDQHERQRRIEGALSAVLSEPAPSARHGAATEEDPGEDIEIAGV